MEAYKTILAQLAQAKALERQKATQANVIKSAAALSELEALIDQYKDTLSAVTDSAQKGRAIKSRGIALCHKEQGYSANGRSVSLLTKSADVPEGYSRVIINKAAGRTLKAINLEGAE